MPKREIPHIDAPPPPLSEQYRGRWPDWREVIWVVKQVPRRLGKLVLVLFTWSIYGTIVLSVLVVAALVVFAFFGGGFGG